MDDKDGPSLRTSPQTTKSCATCKNTSTVNLILAPDCSVTPFMNFIDIAFRVNTQYYVETQLCPLVRRSFELDDPRVCEGRQEPCFTCATSTPLPAFRRCVPNKNVDESDICSEGITKSKET